MERIRRVRKSDPPDGVEELDDVDGHDDGGGAEADLSDEPVFEREEGENIHEAQDRIEQKYRDRAKSPLKAIRAFCVLCMGAQPREVAKCTSTRCVLYHFRFGRNPFQKRGSKA